MDLRDAWRYPQATHVGEARAAEAAVGEAVVSSGGKPHRQLLVGDNLGVILAMERRRAHAYPLLLQVRRCVAWDLASGVRSSFRWLASEQNAADQPSRETGMSRGDRCRPGASLGLVWLAS